MAVYNKFNISALNMLNGVYNLGADALKVMLTNVAPVATNAVKADITEIAAGNGYTAGGAAITAVSDSQTGGTAKLLGTGPVFTASGGSMAPFRYAVFYDSTVAGGPLVGWWDYGSSVTLAVGETFTVSLDAVNGILQLA